MGKQLKSILMLLFFWWILAIGTANADDATYTLSKDVVNVTVIVKHQGDNTFVDIALVNNGDQQLDGYSEDSEGLPLLPSLLSSNFKMVDYTKSWLPKMLTPDGYILVKAHQTVRKIINLKEMFEIKTDETFTLHLSRWFVLPGNKFLKVELLIPDVTGKSSHQVPMLTDD